MKSKKSIVKRIKKTKKGKLIVYIPARAHNLVKKERKVKKRKKSVKTKLWKKII